MRVEDVMTNAAVAADGLQTMGHRKLPRLPVVGDASGASLSLSREDLVRALKAIC